MAVFLLLVVVVLTFLFHQFWWRLQHLPAGPLPLPIIGNAHSFVKSERWERQFVEWKEQYGKIYTYWMGPLPIIAVNDHQLMVEMFVKDGDSFADRCTFEPLDIAARGGLFGIISVSGDLWVEQRRFFLRTMREFGLGRNQMQERVRTIFERLNADIEAKGADGEIAVHDYTDIATGSLINAVICGFRFTANGREEEFYKLKRTTDALVQAVVDPVLHMGVHSHLLAKIPPFRSRIQRLCSLFDEIADFLGGVIDDHLRDHDYAEVHEPTDFIDAYLLEMEKRKHSEQQTFFTRRQLQNVAFDAYVAGQETTAATVTWILAYLIRHPEVQERVHEEMDRVIGSGRLVTMADRLQLPFTNAVILEATRCANIIGQNVPRRLTRDLQISDCLVKKGTAILPQVSVLHVDPTIYPNPHCFQPDRFIDENGQLKRSDQLLPFSLGRRACPGESLAKQEIFFSPPARLPQRC
ncbi:(pine wood nematode) hypothetical protein [Aphelenchoides fujianensis]|nr:(pine wood nematode) hypothetical protein [Aphelenchoides fujianensis]